MVMIGEEDRTRRDGVQGHAIFSPDRRYRYELSRWWGHEALLIFILLNPSTADAHADDPAVRRCMGFARRECYGGVTIANVFAYRTASPEDLAAADDPLGPDNEITLLSLCSAGRTVVAGWGANASHPRLRNQCDWTAGMLAD